MCGMVLGGLTTCTPTRPWVLFERQTARAERAGSQLGGLTTGEYSCRCHGKRVISALSKPLKLKLAGHIL